MLAKSAEHLGFDSVVAAAREGEHWALTELFRAYQPLLLRYLRNQEPRVADDLAGEVWVGVARRLASFTGDESGFRAWLFTIARCRLVEHRRTIVRRRTDPVSHELLEGPDGSPDQGDPARLVLARLSAQEAIDLATAGLSQDQAEAVLLRVLGGLDVAEVARIMQRTPGSVRVLCHRALRRLAELMSEEVMTE